MMRIVLLGTGTSYPDSQRVQSGILVEYNESRVLFDVGSGVLHRLAQREIDLKTLDAVFLSHFHIDHCSDFLTLIQSLWLSSYDRTLKLYAPPFIREWSRGVNDVAFKYLREKIAIETTVLKEDLVVHQGEIVVTNSPTIHGSMDTRAFRIEHEGQILVISSDTAPCREIIELAKGCDVLVHECNWLDGPHPEGVHTSPSELAQVAEKTNPGKLILTHVSPDVVANQKKVVEIVKRRTDAEVFIGEDHMVLDI
ncbi:MAG: MBL fold metallo-hydrolase [Candidatus Thorarchaeota archaeon]